MRASRLALQREFAGIPQNGRVLGSPKAPVTMVEYVDLQCPGCRAFETEVMPSIVPRYAAIAAASQNRMFNFMQVVYGNQGAENTGWLDHAFIEKAAASVPGVQVQRLLDRREVERRHGRRKDDRRAGELRQRLANADAPSRQDRGPLHVVSSKDTFDAARLAAAIRSLS